MLDNLKKDLDLAKIELNSRVAKLKIQPTLENSQAVAEAEKNIEIAKIAYEDASRIQKNEQKEELTELQVYEHYCNARDLHQEMNFGFIRRSADYFIVKKFTNVDKHDKELERITTEIENYGYDKIGRSFIELGHKVAQGYLRKMVEGQSFKVKAPDGSYETWNGERRIYHKLVNTIHTPDKDSYNIIDLKNTIKPTNREEICPWILKCLFNALGAGKEENIEHVEKWIYSVAVADIGNNQTPFPLFYGRGKTGKNALADMVIPSILGKEFVFSSTWDIIGESNFNQFKLGKVMMFIDEIPERGEWNKIKSWTGTQEDYIKIKYGPEYSIDNVIALAFGSNEPNFPFPWENGEQMQRLSPLKAGDKTFAQYVVEHAETMLGKDTLQELVKDKIGYIPDTDHMLGDKFLRNFKPLWIGKEVIQQLVNYLDTKYNPGEDKRFVLQPLRGEDWKELSNDKKDYVERAIDWALEKDTDYIVSDEVYDVYDYMMKKAGKKLIKQRESFNQLAANQLKKLGWIKKQIWVDYENTMHQVLRDGGEKKSSERHVVWFRSDRDIVAHVDSQLNIFFKSVLVNTKETRILSDD